MVAIGNPFGFLNRTVTSGIVSAVQRDIEAPNGFTIPNAIQTDASINPGNSGGPLLNAQGQVIGINSQIATGGGSGGSVGIGFAVPSNEVKRLLPQLKEGEEIKRPFIGISMTPVTDQIAEDLDLPVSEGVLIAEVTEGTAASRAGLRAGEPNTDGLPEGGDVITAVDGKKVTSPDDVASAVAAKAVGDEVELEVYRGDDKRTVTIKLGERPASADQGRRGRGRRGPAALARRPATIAGREHEGEDLRLRAGARRQAGGRPGRLGGGHDPVAGQPARVPARGGGGDRRRPAATGGAGRGVRERHAGRGGAGRRPLLAVDPAASRRRGPRLRREAARRTGAKVMKAIPARDAAAVRDLERFHTDLHLLDAHVPGLRGGTGENFDWELARRHSGRTPLVLSGGLKPENVGEAVARGGAVRGGRGQRRGSLPRREGPRARGGVLRGRGRHRTGERRRAGARVSAPDTSAAREREFGPYGGRFVPETLIPALDELEQAWIDARADEAFNRELAGAAGRVRRPADARCTARHACPSAPGPPSTSSART